MQRPKRAIIPVVLGLFAVAFIALATISYTRESATWDEPQHLTSGYLALRQGDYRLDPEHPPVVRLWAALPLLAMGDIKLDATPIDGADPHDWVGGNAPINEFEFSHDFMYRVNDADRMLYAGRLMIVLLGVLLGVLLFAWTKEWLGIWPAVAVLGLYTLEPNLQAHASLVTTDFGIACFFFGTVYFLWRVGRRPGIGNILGLAVFFSLAAATKFSALALAPVVVLLLAVPVCRRAPWSERLASRRSKALAAAGIGLILGLAAWSGIWAAYRFRYAPSATPGWLFRCERPDVPPGPGLALWRVCGWIDAHRLLPNGYTQGFLLGRQRTAGREVYLEGESSTRGWWSYFPLAFLVKTPIALLVLLVCALVMCALRWRQFGSTAIYALVPMAVYLAFAISSRINIGLRHILPIYPFVLLLSALPVAEFLRAGNRGGRVFLGAVYLIAVLEFARAYPHTLAFFNQTVGGPANGYKYFVDSNLDWGQDLKGLKQWMQQHDVKQINLSYFGTADPAYYGIDCTYIPGVPFWIAHPTPPRLPGYVAVSAQFLAGVGFNDVGKYFYQGLRDKQPVAEIGHSITIYWADRPWWGRNKSAGQERPP
jgi:hypothetical protein